MKVLLQWSRQSPKDWEEIDSSQWKALPKKPLPVGTETIDDSPGYVHYLNIQGVIFTADHYVVDELRDGSGGIRVYAWNDDSQDYADGEFYARVWTFLPLAPDSSLGGAINTRQTQVVYAQSELLSRMKEGLSAENTEYRPWEEFLPPDESITRHGIWVTDVLNNRHVTSLSTKGWRGGGGGEDGPVPPQRTLGRFKKASSTITYYQRDTDRATGVHAALQAANENALETTTGGAVTETSGGLSGGTQGILFVFTSATGEPNSAAWPTGNYRAQLDVTAAGADITYALSAQGSAAGHFGRVNSGLTSPDLETHQTGTGFEGTGLKLDTLSNQAWAAGNATDRFELCISGSRLASHGSQTITLELNTTDSFADGPWSPTPGETAKAMIIRSFASPGSDPTGLAFDGKYLYNCDGVNALIYKLDLRGRVIGSFATPALGPEGLTFDGKYLWTCHDVAGDPIYQLDLKGRIIRSFTAPGIAPVPAGLASDGKYLLYCDGAGLIYKLDFEGTIITSFSPPGSATRGLAFDGKYLWACDRGTDKIYQMDLEGRVVQSFDSPSTIPNGLAFHGGVLWHCDPAADRIYMLDVKPLI